MNWWLYGLALAAVLTGFVNGMKVLKSIRSMQYLQAEIAWQQPDIPYWKYETTNMLAITINDIGLASLTVLLLVSAVDSDVFAFFTKSVISLLLSMLALYGIIITTHRFGSTLAFHFTRGWIHPLSFAICEEGLLYGGSLVGWKSFSHHEIGPDDGLISLYSNHSPSIRTWVINPPPVSFSGVLGIIQKNVPPSPPVDNATSWGNSPLTLILGMAVIALVACLPALWGILHDETWVWVYALAAFILVQMVSGRIMVTFDGQGKYPTKPAMTK